MGFEPMMRVLQTLALPLGHVALRRMHFSKGEWFGQEIGDDWGWLNSQLAVKRSMVIFNDRISRILL
jgi:hypothetical protein